MTWETVLLLGVPTLSLAAAWWMIQRASRPKRTAGDLAKALPRLLYRGDDVTAGPVYFDLRR